MTERSMNTTELLGPAKHANQHRLSRLTMESHSDELRTMALAVEVYNDALVEALESAQRAIGYIREQSAEWERKAISNFEDCSEMAVRIEELESQRKMAFMACNRWADKCRDTEKRVAELEARTVTVRLPSTFWYEHDDLSREVAVLDKRLVKKAIRDACECAGIKCEVKGE